MRDATMKTAMISAALLLVLCLANPATAATKAAGTSGTAAIKAAEAWAFPIEQSPDPSASHNAELESNPNEVLHVPGSTRSYTRGELGSNFVAPDWFPQDHPPAPHVVLYGRKPAWACGACHYANGEGDTDSATLAGLPKAYIIEQIKAFRDGQRVPPDPSMAEEARNLDDADLQQAADYFSTLKLPPIRRVVETATVPRTHWDIFVHALDNDHAREPIGERIIEVSNDQKLYDQGDERTGFVAYVPPGSIEAGAKIAGHGIGTTPGCESCHGNDLQGIGAIPPLAGRSPTYIVKELILFREDKRSNAGAAPMRAEVSHFTLKDMIDAAAYAASRRP